MQLGLLGAGLIPAGHEAQASANLPALAEAVRILEGQDVGQGSDGSHALDVAQQAGLGIAGFRDLFDLSIVGEDALRERSDGRQDGREGWQELVRDGSRGLRMETAGGRGRQAGAGGLDQSAGMVDELGAGSHQAIASAQHRQVGLSLRVAVVDGGEQFGVQPGQAR